MEAGKLDRRITLETSTATRGKSGQQKSEWGTLAIVWANVRYQTPKEVFQADQLSALQTAIFTIRYRTGITAAKNRVVYEGLAYNITGVSEIGRREGLQLIGQADGNESVTPAPVSPILNATATPISDTEIELTWQNP